MQTEGIDGKFIEYLKTVEPTLFYEEFGKFIKRTIKEITKFGAMLDCELNILVSNEADKDMPVLNTASEILLEEQSKMMSIIVCRLLIRDGKVPAFKKRR
jgi:hypothetical protein